MLIRHLIPPSLLLLAHTALSSHSDNNDLDYALDLEYLPFSPDLLEDMRIGVDDLPRSAHGHLVKRALSSEGSSASSSSDDTRDDTSLSGTVISIGASEVQSVSLTPGEVGTIFSFQFLTDADSFVTSYFLSANYGELPNAQVADWTESEMRDHFGVRFYINSTRFGYVESFEEGYATDIAYFTNKQEVLNGTLYVQPYFEANSTLFNDTDKFVMEFAISQDELVFQWDNGTFVELVDADDDSVFFATSSFNTSVETVDKWKNETEYITVHLFDEESYSRLSGLTKSWLAITQASMSVDFDRVETFYTQAMGGLKEQFFISGLNSSTIYHAVITNDFGVNEGGIVYASVEFITQAAGACELIFGLDFCDTVAYSVPQSSNFKENKNMTLLKQVYDDYASSMFTNFTYAMQQIPCDAELDSRYSPIATCDDCTNSYKNWLCGVTIPRCSTINDTNFRERSSGEMRTPALQELIDPPESWYEVLPCIDMCYSIVRNCPSDFGFSCPATSGMVMESYGYYDDDSLYATCNNVGNGSTTAKAITESSGAGKLSVVQSWNGFVLTVLLWVMVL